MQSDFFHPEKLLAAGPAAKIYRGVETATGRKVLIKALLADHEATHPLDRERLQLLVHALLQVRHPQIAGLITLLPTEEEFALVYEFMPGISGRAFAQDRKLSTTDLRALAVQLLNAMLVGEHLRQPHGDLKPSNLIIADHPGGGLFLQVQDWGLTLARGEPAPETLWFSAPERLHGGPATSQSELFTAGASLFYLATGATAAQGSTVEEVLADLGSFDLRHALTHMRPDIETSFADWLAWLLQPDPTRRPQTVADALDVLMHSMHSGFVYQPQTAPEMAPGTATGPLVTGPPNSKIPRAAAPRPPQSGANAKPGSPATGILSKQNPPTGMMPRPQVKSGDATSAVKAAPAPTRKGVSLKVVFAVLLNLGALALVGWFFRDSFKDGGWKQWFSSQDAPAAAVSATTAAEGSGVTGRQVWIELKGKAILNLAEVQVFSGANNIAFQGEASQSSEEYGGKAERAIDGNTDGVFDNNSVSHTHGKTENPAWKLKFPRDVTLNTIIVWNRTDDKWKDRLKDFTVSVRDDKDKVLWEKTITEAPAPRVKLVVGE
jgi:serine/threonine protein kinase